MTGTPPAGSGLPGLPRGWRVGWRRYLFPSLWLVYLTQAVDGVHRYSTSWRAVTGYTIVVVFAGCYVLALSNSWAGRRWRFGGAYLAMVLLTAGAAVFAHERAVVMFVYLTVLAMGPLRRYALPIVTVLTAAAAFGPALIPAWHTGIQTDWVVTIPLIGLAMWGFFGVLRSNVALAAARSEVARLAAENERTRIARDLHDLLGHSLTTVTVKAGLARRLAERGEPDRAAAEIAEVERLSRRTLADVRAAVAGHRDITLTGELATAREALRASGILAELPGSVDVVDPALSELFGWVVREGITNVVRHSRATHCTITLGPGWIEIVDDGRGGLTDPGAGTGLVGLRERVAATRGTVEVSVLNPGWRLRVEVPVPDRDARPDPAPAIGT